jgi:hypothetical protein
VNGGVSVSLGEKGRFSKEFAIWRLAAVLFACEDHGGGSQRVLDDRGEEAQRKRIAVGFGVLYLIGIG